MKWWMLIKFKWYSLNMCVDDLDNYNWWYIWFSISFWFLVTEIWASHIFFSKLSIQPWFKKKSDLVFWKKSNEIFHSRIIKCLKMLEQDLFVKKIVVKKYLLNQMCPRGVTENISTPNSLSYSPQIYYILLCETRILLFS